MQVGVPRETAPDERRVALVPDIVSRLTGSGFTVVVETVFAWPGIGYLADQALNNQDLILLQAIVFVVAVIVAVAGAVGDAVVGVGAVTFAAVVAVVVAVVGWFSSAGPRVTVIRIVPLAVVPVAGVVPVGAVAV